MTLGQNPSVFLITLSSRIDFSKSISKKQDTSTMPSASVGVGCTSQQPAGPAPAHEGTHRHSKASHISPQTQRAKEKGQARTVTESKEETQPRQWERSYMSQILVQDSSSCRGDFFLPDTFNCLRSHSCSEPDSNLL